MKCNRYPELGSWLAGSQVYLRPLILASQSLRESILQPKIVLDQSIGECVCVWCGVCTLVYILVLYRPLI